MDKDNQFRSCSFYLAAGDVVHIRIKDLTGTLPYIDLVDDDEEVEDEYPVDVKYGALYNWYAATDVRNIAPIGWHVPSWNEFDTLSMGLGGNAVSGGELKEIGTIHWNTPNTGANNNSGFTARGSGQRINTNGLFNGIQIIGSFWNIEELDAINGRVSSLYNSNTLFWTADGINGYGYPKGKGIGIRPLKDDSTDPGTVTGNDGKLYPTVKIGNQVWMACNLAETKYRNGDIIPIVTDDVTWAALTTGAMCYYDNDINNR